MDALETKYAVLKKILGSYRSLAVAFSGGVDSTFLLAAAKQILGCRLTAVTVDSAFIPRCELAEAAVFCTAQNIRQIVFRADVLAYPEICGNPPNRCYYCKKMLFQNILRIADDEGIAVVADGSNADDLTDYRPGMQALKELKIQSPLCEAGLTKQEIRILSRAMQLPSSDKPSAACLASRIPYGDTITAENLSMAERAEQYLKQFGVRQLRVRIHGNIARIEVMPDDFSGLLRYRSEISETFRTLGFQYTTLDLSGYRTGSLNEVLYE